MSRWLHVGTSTPLFARGLTLVIASLLAFTAMGQLPASARAADPTASAPASSSPDPSPSLEPQQDETVASQIQGSTHYPSTYYPENHMARGSFFCYVRPGNSCSAPGWNFPIYNHPQAGAHDGNVDVAGTSVENSIYWYLVGPMNVTIHTFNLTSTFPVNYRLQYGPNVVGWPAHDLQGLSTGDRTISVSEAGPIKFQLSSISPPGSGLGFDGITVESFSLPIPTCDQEQVQAHVTPQHQGSRVTIAYDPRFIVSPNAYPSNYEDLAKGLAEGMRDRLDYALDQYEALGFPTDDNLTVEISCDPYLVTPVTDVIPEGTGAFTEASDKIKLTDWWVHDRFDSIVAAGFPTGWNRPPTEWVNVLDHEALHTTQAAQLWQAVQAFRYSFGSKANFESGAVLGQDLITDADDTQNFGTFTHHYLDFVGRLFGPLTDAGDQAYNIGALMQFLGEHYGPPAPTSEERVAGYLRRVVGSISSGVGALEDAMGGGPVADRGRSHGAIRDFYVGAYLLHKLNIPPAFQLSDARVPRPPSTTVPTYPVLQPTPLVIGLPVTGNTGAASGLVYESHVPPGTTWLSATFENLTPYWAKRTALSPTAVVPMVDSTSFVRADLFSAGPTRGHPQCVAFNAQGLTTVGLIMATSLPMPYRISLSTATQASIDVLSATSDGRRIRVVVRPTLDGVFSSCLVDAELTATINGHGAPITQVEHLSDRLIVSVPLPDGTSGSVSYEIRMGNVTGTGQHYMSLPMPPPLPRPAPAEPTASGTIGTLGQGQSQSIAVPVASGSRAAGFVASWQGSTFAFRLTSPSGRVIDDSNTDPDVTIVRTATSTEIDVASPEAGSWQLEATGTEVPVPEPVTYAVAEYDPLLRADPTVTATGGAGTPIDASIALSDAVGPLTGATVIASVADPAGTTRVFPLLDLAAGIDAAPDNGTYAARIFATDLAGSYSVVIKATGTDTGGVAYSREETSTIVLGPKVDTDGDGVADVTETLLGLDPADPTDGVADQDGDGLSTAAEVAAGSDPFNADTDGGGEGDASELAAGRIPWAAADDGSVGQAILSAAQQDGRMVRIDLAGTQPSDSIHLWRLEDATTVDLGVHPGTGETLTDGPIAGASVRYRAIPTGVTGAVGVASDSGPITILVDATRPFVRVHLNLDAPTTGDPALNVSLTDIGEPTPEMRYALSADALATAAWIPFVPSFIYQLPAEPGDYRLFVQVRDATGLVSPVADAAIVLDTVPPSSTANAIPAYTLAASVAVPYTATDDVSGVWSVDLWSRFRATTTAPWGAWTLGSTAFQSPVTYTFGLGFGFYEFYTVATDSAGNEETPPATADAATQYTGTPPPDTIAPTVPTGLTATAVGGARVDLAWTASTDNVGVRGYKIWRNNVYVSAIGIVGSVSISDTGLAGNTTYSYTVSAIDAAGKESAKSVAAGATTAISTDSVAPTVPTGVSATASAWNSVSVTWTASTDNVGVTRYTILRAGVALGVVAGSQTSFVDRTTLPSTAYAYTVKASDAAGRISAASAAASVTTPACASCTTVTLRPTSDVSAAGFTPNTGTTRYTQLDEPTSDGDTTYIGGGVSGTGNAVFGMGGPAGSAFAVTVNYVAKATSSGTMNVHAELYNGTALLKTGATHNLTTAYAPYSDTFTSLNVPAATLRLKLVQTSASTATITSRFTYLDAVATYFPADTIAPSVPGSLKATANGGARVDLSWTGSTDAIGVKGYKLYRNGVYLAAVGIIGSTSISDTGLAGTTTYTYTVSAIDAAGKESAKSSAKSATTGIANDTVAPSIPTHVHATATAWNSVTVTWNASTDNVGVTRYTILRGATVIGVVSGSVLSFTDRTTVASTAYSYTVKASDAAGRISAASSPAAAVTTPALS